jgi:hypothetical protein
MRGLPVVLGLLCFATAASAQERLLGDLGLPRDAQRRLTRVVDDSATRRYNGATSVSPADTVYGNVVVFDGPLNMQGRIVGELIVVGDALFAAGSEITGDVTIVGGDARDIELADIGGTVTVYGEGFELFHRGERIIAVNTHRNRGPRYIGAEWGHASFAIRAGNYNRVEGMPVLFGPAIQTGGSSPTRLEALGILRTGSGDMFDPDRMGYQVRLEQFIGRSDFRLGGTVHSIIDPIESWNLSNLEATLATFLLHEDQRDYYDRAGWGAYARYGSRRSRLDLMAGYWDEEYRTRVARDPWTLFGDGGWRPQPLVAEGRLQSLQGRVQYDGRYGRSRQYASSGFFIAASAVHGLDGALELPARTFAIDSIPVIEPGVAVNDQFNSGLLDVRLYTRINRSATIALRGAAGGSLDGKSLPPQFQHALGGSGTMPGYSLFSADCGARRIAVVQEGGSSSFFPYYGCDRFALGSIEFRGGFDLDFGGGWDMWGDEDDYWNWHLDASPTWLLFFNAGQGWALDDSRKLGARDTGVLYDAGAGFVLGDFGIYAAVPLSGSDHSPRFSVRLGARF